MKAICCKVPSKLISTDRCVGENHLFFQCEKCGDVQIYVFNDNGEDVGEITKLKTKLGRDE